MLICRQQGFLHASEQCAERVRRRGRGSDGERIDEEADQPLDLGTRSTRDWSADDDVSLSGRSTQDGGLLHDTGGTAGSVGATLAFRPRPMLDLQLFVEAPVYQDLNGLQLEEGPAVFFVVGIRI